VVGNLSTTDQFFSAIREAGAIQRLVRLLDSGSTNRTTEIAAKTLANLASESSNRKGIRLAGGVPPLMRLLMDKPSEQVRPCSCHFPFVSLTFFWTVFFCVLLFLFLLLLFCWQCGCERPVASLPGPNLQTELTSFRHAQLSDMQNCQTCTTVRHAQLADLYHPSACT